MKKFNTKNSNHFINENGAMIEVLGIEPSIQLESMNWYNPYVDVQVRVYDDEKDFSVCFTINKYVVPEEYIPENWHNMSSKEIWNVVSQNIFENIGNLNVLNAILPLDSAIDSAMIDLCEKRGVEENLSDDILIEALLFESNWNFWTPNMIGDFKILKSECAVQGNCIDDYITDLKIEQNL